MHYTKLRKLVKIAFIIFMIEQAYVISHILDRTDPIIWKNTNKMVYGKRIEFKILLMLVNPSNEFSGHSNARPHWDGKQQCEKLYQSEWIGNIRALG